MNILSSRSALRLSSRAELAGPRRPLAWFSGKLAHGYCTPCKRNKPVTVTAAYWVHSLTEKSAKWPAKRRRDMKLDVADRDAYGHPRLPLRGHYQTEECDARRRWVEKLSQTSLPHTGQWWLENGDPFAATTRLRGNIENVIGLTKIPVGIAGPLLLRGEHVRGYVVVPYATTEGALVASATRGATALMRAGGARVRTLGQSMERGPCFETRSLEEAIRLADYLRNNVDEFQHSVCATSQHARLTAVDAHVIGKSVFAHFCYETGDAAGQNMTTSATWKVCQWALKKLKREPERNITVERFYLETKQSRDKGAGHLNVLRTRGTAAQAEVYISESVLLDTLKVSSELSHTQSCW